MVPERARGSEVTAEVYLRRLGNFCSSRGISPKELASMPDRKLRDLFMDFVSEEEKEGHAGSYIKSVLKALKSWLAHHGRTCGWKIKIKGVGFHSRKSPSGDKTSIPSSLAMRSIDLFHHHPRGKDYKFYLEIRRIIQEELRRRKKRRKTNLNLSSMKLFSFH